MMKQQKNMIGNYSVFTNFGSPKVGCTSEMRNKVFPYFLPLPTL